MGAGAQRRQRGALKLQPALRQRRDPVSPHKHRPARRDHAGGLDEVHPALVAAAQGARQTQHRAEAGQGLGRQAALGVRCQRRGGRQNVPQHMGLDKRKGQG